MVKAIIIAFFVSKSLYDLFSLYLENSDKNRPLPDNVRDVYDEERYKKYLAYKKENGRLDLCISLLSFVINLLFLLFNVYAHVFSLLEGLNIYLQYFIAITMLEVFLDIIMLPLHYHGTFVIEEKYEMNKTTRKTFFLDTLKNSMLEIIISMLLFSCMIFFFSHYGIKGVIGTSIAVIAFTLAVVALVLPLLKIFNKFTPLEDGELKDKLLALCEKYNVKVKRIVVKDASRRTTTSNAFCTGLKSKTISLDDNLVKNFSSDEIVAVFAHEFAHAKYKHMLKTLPLGIIASILTVLFFGILLEWNELFIAFGFTGVNYLFAGSAPIDLIWPLTIGLKILSNAISRKHEFEADAFAAKEGYGEALISALKRLHNEALSEINPQKWIVITEYSHPTLSARISAIERAERKAQIIHFS